MFSKINFSLGLCGFPLGKFFGSGVPSENPILPPLALPAGLGPLKSFLFTPDGP